MVLPLPPIRWPGQLIRFAEALRHAAPPCREACRASLWTVLHAALFAALRSQSGRLSGIGLDDLEDLASQKSLELLLRAEQGSWDPAGRTEQEVAGYVSRVARHALVDLIRQRGRECPGPEDVEAWSVALADPVDEPSGPEDELCGREFARALSACVDQLAPRARQAWFRRVYLERPSREIATGLGIGPAHVDVVVQRARHAIRQCMEGKGHRNSFVRPGTFVELWRRLSDESPVESEDREAMHRDATPSG